MRVTTSTPHKIIKQVLKMRALIGRQPLNETAPGPRSESGTTRRVEDIYCAYTLGNGFIKPVDSAFGSSKMSLTHGFDYLRASHRGRIYCSTAHWHTHAYAVTQVSIWYQFYSQMLLLAYYTGCSSSKMCPKLRSILGNNNY